jgi:hypothetical protein
MMQELVVLTAPAPDVILTFANLRSHHYISIGESQWSRLPGKVRPMTCGPGTQSEPFGLVPASLGPRFLVRYGSSDAMGDGTDRGEALVPSPLNVQKRIRCLQIHVLHNVPLKHSTTVCSRNLRVWRACQHFVE